MKISWCKALQVAYHMAFAGGMFSGGEYYLEEIRKVERSIVHQVDRVEGIVLKAEAKVDGVVFKAETMVNRVDAGTAKAIDAVSQTTKQIKSIEASLNKVKNICSTSIFGG